MHLFEQLPDGQERATLLRHFMERLDDFFQMASLPAIESFRRRFLYVHRFRFPALQYLDFLLPRISVFRLRISIHFFQSRFHKKRMPQCRNSGNPEMRKTWAKAPPD